MNRTIYASLFFAFTFLSSCFLSKKGSHKKKEKIETAVVTDTVSIAHADTMKVPPPLPVDSAVVKKQLMDALAPIWAKRLDYKTFSAKARIRYETPDDSKEFTVNIRMKKDSVIWATITLLGIPAARVLVTTDSIFLVNFVQREVTKIPLTEAAKLLPTAIDFSSLQNVVAGDPLRGGTMTAATEMPNAWEVQIEDKSYVQYITYAKLDSVMTIGRIKTHDPNGPVAKIDYSKYEKADNRKVSMERAIKIQNGTDFYNIDISYSGVEFDKEMEYPFSIPKNYKQKK